MWWCTIPIYFCQNTKHSSTCSALFFLSIYEDLDDEGEDGEGGSNQTYETGIVHENKDGTSDVLYEKATVSSSGESTYEKKMRTGNVNASSSGATNQIEHATDKKEEGVAPFDEVSSSTSNIFWWWKERLKIDNKNS